MHSKFVGHSTEIIRQNKIKGPLLQTLKKKGMFSEYQTTKNRIFKGVLEATLCSPKLG